MMGGVRHMQCERAMRLASILMDKMATWTIGGVLSFAPEVTGEENCMFQESQWAQEELASLFGEEMVRDEIRKISKFWVWPSVSY